MSRRLYAVNEHAFDEMRSAEQWYWLGFLLGDGCVFVRRDQREWRLQVGLWTVDREHLDRLSRFLGFAGPLHDISSRAYVHLVVYSEPLCRRLVELGVAPRKSFEGHPLPVVPNRFLHAFSRGHFDANGHASKVSKNGYKLGFSGQHRLMRWLQEKIRHLVGPKPGLFYDRGGCAELVYGRRRQVEEIARWLYGLDDGMPAAPCLDRKRAVLAPVLQGV